MGNDAHHNMNHCGFKQFGIKQVTGISIAVMAVFLCSCSDHPPSAPNYLVWKSQVLTGHTLNPALTSVLDRNSVDLGTVIQGKEIQHFFVSCNRLYPDMRILSIEKSCGCTEAQVLVRDSHGEWSPYILGSPIAWQAEYCVALLFSTYGKSGKSVSTVTPIGQHGKRVGTYRLLAEVLPPLTITPAALDFGEIDPGESVSLNARVTSSVADRFKLTLSPIRNESEFKLELTPVSPDSDGQSHEWDLRATRMPESKVGSLVQAIRVKSNIRIEHKDASREDQHFYETDMFLRGHVLEPVSLVPPRYLLWLV